MAITLYTPGDLVMAFKEQAVWGTAGTADFIRADYELTAIDPDTQVRIINASSAKRTVPAAYHIHDTKGSVPKITLSGWLKKDDAAHFFYGLYQNVLEAEATPFQKTYTFGTTQPDFTASAGWFGSVAIISPVASTTHVLCDCIVSEIRGRCNPGERLWVDVDLVARGGLTRTAALATAASTTAVDTTDFFHFSDITALAEDPTSYQPMSIAFAIRNGAIPSPSPDLAVPSRFLTWVLPKYSAECTLQVIWAAAHESIDENVVKSWFFRWGAVTPADGYLGFDFEGKPKVTAVNSGEVRGTQVHIVTSHTTYGGCRVKLADAIDRTW